MSDAIGPVDVVVLGDIMLDEYIVVKHKSESRDSIIPNLTEVTREYALGGAANVAANIQAMDPSMKVSLLGCLGYDDEALMVARLCVSSGIDVKSSIRPPAGRVTTRKTRLVAEDNRGVLVRHDHEVTDPVHEIQLHGMTAAEMIKARVDAMVTRVPAVGHNDRAATVVISDYGKGMCTRRGVEDVVNMCHNRGIALLVDPNRQGEWDYYHSASTLFKINLQQAMTYLEVHNNARDFRAKYARLCMRIFDQFGDKPFRPEPAEPLFMELYEAVRDTMLQYGQFRYLWITLARHGSVIGSVGQESNQAYIPAVPTKIVSTVGAGDTSMAAMAWHLTARDLYDWPTVLGGARVANYASAYAVSQPGTTCVTRSDLLAASTDNAAARRGASHAEPV